MATARVQREQPFAPKVKSITLLLTAPEAVELVSLLGDADTCYEQYSALCDATHDAGLTDSLGHPVVAE